MIDFRIQRPAFLALAAAALFGASTPFAKLLLGDVTPAMLAALLYLGSGLGLSLARLAGTVLPWSSSGGEKEADNPPSPIAAAQWVWLAAAIACGGVCAPLLLLWGLQRSSATGAALLLNAESVLTTLLAAAIFGEQVGRRVWLASAVMLAAGLALAWSPGAALAWPPGALAVLGACLFWALDNNFTRRISGGDAMAIAMLKGYAAGGVNLVIALAAGSSFPAANHLFEALLLGAFAYGASLVLYVRALRHLGSARTGAHFAVAPFAGAAIALALGEAPASMFWPALALMLLATWLMLTEHHGHRHSHEPTAHAHEHMHDEHHRHAHASGDEPADGGPHAHHHVHEAMMHFHPHLPDLHHRHRH